MLSTVTRHTPSELLADFLSAVDWIRTEGFEVGRGRIAHYQKALTKAVERYEIHGWTFEDQDHAQEVCTTLLEIREFISIHRGLSSIPDEVSTRDIPQLLKGPFLPNEESTENSSNKPRNIGFELYLTALFSAAGIPPIYGSDADLEFDFNGYQFYLEAKRPALARNSGKLIKAANKQLKQRLKDSKNEYARGLIALDLTKAVNPKNKVSLIESESHLDNVMKGEVDKQIEALSEYWNDRRPPGVIGVLLNLKILASFGQSRDLVTVRWVGFVPLGEAYTIANLAAKLERVIRHVC